MRWLVVAAAATALLWTGLWTVARAQGPLPSTPPVTYQGFLADNGVPVNGLYDFAFTLYPTSTGGVQITPTVTVEDVNVVDGIFTALVDFGVGVFTGEPTYVQIAVRPGASGGVFTPLAPRQQLAAAPMALALPGLWTRPFSVSVNIIGGYPGNKINDDVIGAVIGGGGRPASDPQSGPNQITANYGVIAGGSNNVLSGTHAFIGGGHNHQAGGVFSVIGGGRFNSTSEFSGISVIGGGQGNEMDAVLSIIGGGFNNEIRGNNQSFIGGGSQNQVTDNNGVIAGGSLNIVGNSNNLPFDAENATVGGGIQNKATATGATVPGGDNNTASGAYSFAAGRNATAGHAGAFVWADSLGVAFASTADNQVRFRATGGFQIATTAGGAGVKLDNGDTAWEVLSDRNVKTDIEPVDGLALLDALASMPVSRWRYLWEEKGEQHIGPMAQDFYAAFGLGDDEQYISTLDADGVALATIQALYGVVQEQEAQIEALQQQNAELSARLDALEGK